MTPFCEDRISRTGRLFGRPAFYDLEEKMPGSVFLSVNSLRAEPIENPYWMVLGKLEKEIPKGPFRFGLLMKMPNGPQDFEGEFSGHVGRGEIYVVWKKSGASMNGISPGGYFKFKGKSVVRYK
ncbi:hypothetical protein DFQ27_003504 [Actinomortierella ambigua]|uniref:Uncharacterized protein n=1 Tax=Actinomortierella ambigua TaxID=1343610 RepID=A0A9P6U5R6_9FUNG|nr:hypothetical protein DFQ27_003504 [Actinomortierella ambigua]